MHKKMMMMKLEAIIIIFFRIYTRAQ